MAQTLSDLVVPKKPSGIAPTLRDFGRGYNREAVAGLLGAPVDMATTLANLLMAGGGYLGHKAGLLDQPPDLIPNNRAVGSSDWIYDRLPHQPALSNSPAEQAGRLAGALMSPPAVLKAAPTTIRALFDALQEKAPSVIDKYMDAMGAKQNAIVYHGSPHKFDKFDSSKIGTGEGAQAYGHGLYLADSPRVAKSYAEELGNLEILHNGKVVGVFDKDPAANAAHQIRASGGNVEKAVKRAANIYSGAWKEKVIDEIKRLGPGIVGERSGGSLYTVDLPDSTIARMLDWDKPLSAQPMDVRNSFARAYKAKFGNAPSFSPEEIYGRQGYDMLAGGATGMHAFQDISAATSELLRKKGIPGIRYLDGGSRGAGAGTSNYVVFPGEEGVLKILKRE